MIICIFLNDISLGCTDKKQEYGGRNLWCSHIFSFIAKEVTF
jgi:hypothetical protein